MQQIGPYTVLEELARGGQGVVYRARDASGRVVALKLLLAQRAANQHSRKRFQVEVQTLSRLQHPNVVSILATGEHEGAPWLALDFVEGESLETRLRRGPLPIPEAIRIAQQLSQALSYVHGCGVLHRDLKPDNVLLRGDQALLTDFGLARDVDGAATRITTSGVFLGTPGYWPPEQARGELAKLGPGSDVYGLGAILYACLTGRPPVQAESLQGFLESMRFRTIPPPSRRRPEVPAWLNALCMRCLARDPAYRPRAADEVERALARGDSRDARGPRKPVSASGSAAARIGIAAVACALLAGGVAWQSSRTPATAGDAARPPRSTSETPSANEEPASFAPQRPFLLPASISKGRRVSGAFVEDALVTVTSNRLHVWKGREAAAERVADLPTGPPGSSWSHGALLPLSAERVLIGRVGLELSEWNAGAFSQHEVRSVRAFARSEDRVAYGSTSGRVGVLRVGAKTLHVAGAEFDLGRKSPCQVKSLSWLSPTRLVVVTEGLELGRSGLERELDPSRASVLHVLSYDLDSSALGIVDSQELPGAYDVAISKETPPTVVVGTAAGHLFLFQLERKGGGERLVDVGRDMRTLGAPTSCFDLLVVRDSLCVAALNVRSGLLESTPLLSWRHLNGLLIYELTGRTQDTRARVLEIPEFGARRLAYDAVGEQVVVFGTRGEARVFDLEWVLEHAKQVPQ